jgi:hypothetical protein
MVRMIKSIGYIALLGCALVYPWTIVIIALLFLAEYVRIKRREV